MRLQAPREEQGKGNKKPKSQAITKEPLEIVREGKERKLFGQNAGWKEFWKRKQINRVLLLDSQAVQGNRTLLFFSS